MERLGEVETKKWRPSGDQVDIKWISSGYQVDTSGYQVNTKWIPVDTKWISIKLASIQYRFDRQKCRYQFTRTFTYCIQDLADRVEWKGMHGTETHALLLKYAEEMVS